MFKLIVACDRKGGIGLKNKIPWHLSKDLKFFSSKTKGNGNNAVIMGKNTYKSIGKLLPNRHNIILSTTLEEEPNLKICRNKLEVLNYCKKNNFDEVWIIGGSQIYDLFLKEKNLIDTIFITVIDKDFECDCFLTCSTMTIIMENYHILSPKIEQIENKLKFTICEYNLKLEKETVWEGYGLGKFL